MMQLKRIFVSLLVAVMMISMAVLAVSAAETENNTFVVAVDAVDNEGYLAVTPGETVDVSIIVTNNPGVCYATLRVIYDADALECVDDDYTPGDLFQIGLVQSVAGRTAIITDLGASKDVTDPGTIVTLTFKVKDTFTGDKVQVAIDKVEALNENGVNVDWEVAVNEGPEVPAECTHEQTVEIPAVPATCVDAGMSSGKKCAACGVVVDEPKVVPATNDHTPNIDEATCTAAQICTVCDKELAPVAAHTPVAIGTEIPATCTNSGMTAGEKCSVCEVIITAQAPIEKLAHTEVVIPAVNATCTATGLSEGKKCSVCGTITVEQTVVPTKAHTEETIAAVAATCTAAGSTEGKKCSVCGVVTVAPEVVQPVAHTVVEIPAVEPTYSETGSTAGKQCSVCNEIIDAPNEIPAKSLAWLWVLIICVVVAGGGAAAVYFLVIKKKIAK